MKDMLTFLGIVLIFFSVFFRVLAFRYSKGEFTSRLKYSLKFGSFRIKTQNQVDQYINHSILYFQYWGLFLLLCGAVFSVVGDDWIGSFAGSLIMVFIFFFPVVLWGLDTVIKKKL